MTRRKAVIDKDKFQELHLSLFLFISCSLSHRKGNAIRGTGAALAKLNFLCVILLSCLFWFCDRRRSKEINNGEVWWLHLCIFFLLLKLRQRLNPVVNEGEGLKDFVSSLFSFVFVSLLSWNVLRGEGGWVCVVFLLFVVFLSCLFKMGLLCCQLVYCVFLCLFFNFFVLFSACLLYSSCACCILNLFVVFSACLLYYSSVCLLSFCFLFCQCCVCYFSVLLFVSSSFWFNFVSLLGDEMY